MYHLADKVVVITGAAAGIGLALAEAFANAGAVLALIDRSDAVLSTAKTLGGKHRGYVANLEDEAGIAETFEKIVGELKTIHILVNNAGIGLLAPALDLKTEDWDKTMLVNLRAPFLCAKAAGQHMVRQGWGRVITIASQAAVIGIEGHTAYSASKAGLIGLTNCLALEWGPSGVTANCISPTVVETELAKVYWSGEKGDIARGEIPMRRFVKPSEVAATALFLAGDDAGMINGANIMIDGGNTIR